ncbi:hypothetical protein [Peribacillus kribbensis]|uniref:hypothetical protein n=1 Tax=Peribacillus kribbensis TaxID=356658 RepID=UPI0004088ABE|nr:hypothetical protein [Peribacillus kribbensis]
MKYDDKGITLRLEQIREQYGERMAKTVKEYENVEAYLRCQSCKKEFPKFLG